MFADDDRWCVAIKKENWMLDVECFEDVFFSGKVEKYVVRLAVKDVDRLGGFSLRQKFRPCAETTNLV